MTPSAAQLHADLELPWRALDCHLARWRAVVRFDRYEARLSASELLDLCAATELERYPAIQVQDAVRLRSGGYRVALTWAQLVDGASGLTRRHAPGERTLGWCLEECGIELVRFEYGEAR